MTCRQMEYSGQFPPQNDFGVDIVFNSILYVVICKSNYFRSRTMNLMILDITKLYLALIKIINPHLNYYML